MAKTRNYKQEYADQQSSTAAKKDRAARNKARRMMVKAGKVHKGDGMDVDHVVPLSKGGANIPSNMRIKTESANSSFSRNSDGSVKRNVTKKKIKAQ